MLTARLIGCWSFKRNGGRLPEVSRLPTEGQVTMQQGQSRTVDIGRGLVVLVAALFVIAALIAASIGGCSVIRNWHRGQVRADANNKVQITHILIRNAQQRARVVKAQNASVRAKAEQRYLQSVGIRRAQDEIAKTLTPLYIQHEAIEAQLAVATSGKNNTVVYVPSGANGVPMVLPAAQGKLGANP
jgi:hypothetical protein